MPMEAINATLRLIVPALMETLYMAGASTILAYLLGFPLGVLLVITAPGHIAPRRRLNRLLGACINALRSAPFIILMVAMIPITVRIVGTSIGTTAAIVPLVAAATPFVARMVETSLTEVPFGTVEAALVMGATPWQIVWKVLLPEAKPSIILGAAVSSISIIGYTAMAGAIGGGGLGDLAIQYGYNRFRTDIMLATLLLLIAVVQLVQQVGQLFARRIDRR
jgi:D-methionine transport system permease protein